MKGILFKPEMIQAIREGRKTVTRRIIKQKPLNGATGLKQHGDEWLWVMDDDICMGNVKDRIKPRYQSGETVYVKEAWATDKMFDRMSPKQIEGTGVATVPLWYKQNDNQIDNPKTTRGRWRSPMMMPEWAARTFLLIEDVRPERLQEITENEAEREGVERLALSPDTLPDVPPPFNKVHPMTSTYLEAYVNLWDSINKPPYDWKANPWVWRIQFKVVENGRLK